MENKETPMTEKEKESVAALAFALCRTLAQLSPPDRDMVLAPFTGLTPPTLAAWPVKEIVQMTADALLAMLIVMIDAGLADKLQALELPSFTKASWAGIRPCEN